MKQEPRPAIHVQKSLLTAWVAPEVGWDRVSRLWGRADSVSQVDEFPDMALACQLFSSVALWGRSQKGTMASAHLLSESKLSPESCLDTRHFSSSPYATGAFQAATPVLELRESEYEYVHVWVL